MKHAPTTSQYDVNAELAAYSGAPTDMERINAYALTQDPDKKGTMRARAQIEAQNMLATGDTSKYRAELEKNGIIMRAMGY